MLAGVRRTLRRHVPEPVRVQAALSRRYLADRLSGHAALIIRNKAEQPSALAGWPEVVAVGQVIRPSEHWKGKLHNLQLGAGRLQGVTIDPGRIFSFWALVGRPVQANGYQVGRSIRADVLGADIGGGLCQLSGLTYELGLRAGMEVIERHPHSADLYTEATRFTPLGLDATVVWGYKDLRLRNNCQHPVAFTFELTFDQIVGCVRCRDALQPARLEIRRTDGSESRSVQVSRTQAGAPPEVVSSDTYRVAAPMA